MREIILRNRAEHMLDIVNSLLDLSAIEAGRYDLAPEAVTIAELVTEILPLLSLTADRAEVALGRMSRPTCRNCAPTGAPASRSCSTFCRTR